MKRSVVVGALGTAQTLAWGSSYYLPAILADPIAHGLGLSRTMFFGFFSGALLLSAVLGPAVGRAIGQSRRPRHSGAFQSGLGGRARPARRRTGICHLGSPLGCALAELRPGLSARQQGLDS